MNEQDRRQARRVAHSLDELDEIGAERTFEGFDSGGQLLTLFHISRAASIRATTNGERIGAIEETLGELASSMNTMSGALAALVEAEAKEAGPGFGGRTLAAAAAIGGGAVGGALELVRRLGDQRP